MQRQSSASSRFRSGAASLSVIALAIVAAPAQAQSAPPAADAPAAPNQEIVVTGSYLGNIRQEDRASPVLSVDTKAMERTGGNLTQAAKLLDISRDQLRYKLRKSGAYETEVNE